MSNWPTSSVGGDKWNNDNWDVVGASNNAAGDDGFGAAIDGNFSGGSDALGGENHNAAGPGGACRNCSRGHEAIICKNPKAINHQNILEKSENEAWGLLKNASDMRHITDFKDALQIFSKAAPNYTYPRLEKEFRERGSSVFLIAMKPRGDTWTNVNLQGEIGRKYAVSYFLSGKPQRRTPEENLIRLADAGIPLDRGVDKCHNCGNVGHKSKSCPEEAVTKEPVPVFCYLCGETGHRVRNCTQERKPAGRACASGNHIAKDCRSREKRTCRRCGEEGHMARAESISGFLPKIEPTSLLVDGPNPFLLRR
ncbi:uncharacterized protein Z518_09893 [Rhinocladiella mackenziei CBS 650.93]|uniref:CCHC-type domain-containing protein n=1 Tax=Rhinocladiella mackenziei CBS 650.93 TaxID=1442369 RepID=A0A0D2GR80_9EURO|nr:uncharacterized protein Z518_09893 [Rhinocladiella mackenziei CBS 650.93]KIX00828.1 hypothetical protein Z518_09893 [Rhinocladiella mackenziei CBS 650.93]